MKDPFTDAIVAQPKHRELRERDIQNACVAYARSRGWWARKFSSPAQRSVPDYLFAKGTVKLAVEFKALGKHSTNAQTEEQILMRNAGWMVWSDVGRGGEQDIIAFKRRLDELGSRGGE